MSMSTNFQPASTLVNNLMVYLKFIDKVLQIMNSSRRWPESSVSADHHCTFQTRHGVKA